MIRVLQLSLLAATLTAFSMPVTQAFAEDAGLSYYKPDPSPPPRNPPPRNPPPRYPDPNPPPHRPPPHRPPPHRPPPHRPPPVDPPRYDHREVSKRFTDYYSDERISLSQEMSLWRYDGYTVTSVDVYVRNGSSFERLTLMINGIIEDSVTPSRRLNTLDVRGFKQIGDEVQFLDLLVEGEVYIESVTVYLSRDRW